MQGGCWRRHAGLRLCRAYLYGERVNCCLLVSIDVGSRVSQGFTAADMRDSSQRCVLILIIETNIINLDDYG